MTREPAPFDFFTAGELPAPTLPLAEATELAAALGVAGRSQSLGSQQDQNFLVTGAAAPLAVLKIANPAFPDRETAAQDAAATAVQGACPHLRVGTPLAAARSFDTSEGPLTVRALRFLPGGTLVDRGYLAPAVVERMGSIAGRVSAALEGFEHPGLERTLQWDLREAARVVALLGGHHPDAARHERVVRATDAAWSVVQSVAADLPVQPGHFDLTDDNLVSEVDGPLPDGIIDFGDLSRGWRVAELAVTLSCLLHHAGGEPHTVLPAVRAFDAIRRLNDAELEALWPLVVLRGAVLVVSGEHQVGVDAQNDYASAALDREWRMFATADSVPTAVMTALIRDAVGRLAAAPDLPPAGLLLPVAPAPLDLSITTPAADDGAWLEPGWADRVAAAALAGGVGAVAAPAGVARIGETRILAAESSPTVPTGATVWVGASTTFAAPWAGQVLRSDDGSRVELRAQGLRLLLHRTRPAGFTNEGTCAGTGPDTPRNRSSEGDAPSFVVAAGEALATVAAGARVEVQLLTSQEAVPLLVRPETAAGWLALTLDPASLLGLPAAQPAPDPMARRDAHLADVQEHYYADPPRIERGWRVHLVGTDGRASLDMVNNVTSVGHAHPRITAAVARQLSLLNTNSRFHYAAVADFAAALAATLPDPLDTVFLVNSGSEATDLAIRLAQAATGRPDIVAVREAYHGWTYASDAVSTSIADNPNALATRPQWVHVVDAPNPYRGRHRDAEAHRYGPEAAARIDELAASGRPPAAFIAEPFFGNAGGVALPDGYLAEVYSVVHAAGGLAIADEVQVGYGRLGAWFWGFEQQQVVPDVVAVAKSMGNGHPLGAVITSREIAARYREGGYFFSSTGGSPVSSVVGLTVLDIIRTEGLQENARVVGEHLKAALEALAERHPLIGAVHGSGLYLGVEFVRDRATRQPATAETAAICDHLRDLGVIMQPTGDFLNVLKIKPPLVLAAEEADFFVLQLDRVLTDGW